MLRPERSFEAPAALPDEEIVERVRRGETGLFELLMRRYNQRLFRIARSILHDGEEAEDVMQDAYVRAYEHLSEFQGRARFSTWLTRIAVYEALGRLRRRSRLVPLDLSPAQEARTVERLDSGRHDPEDQASGRELGTMLSDVVDGLPELYRTVFVLREVEDLSTAEVAECLELSEENVKVRLHRARALLRDAIDQRLGTETRQLYAFHLSRCDRVVERVLQRILRPA